MSRISRPVLVAALLTVLIVPAPAFGEVSDFLGNWVNDDNAASGITRVVVTRASEGRLSIQVFGRCRPTDCDWGMRPAHAYRGAPDSDDVLRLTADFDAGFAQEHITLRPAPGGALYFDVLTDFTDNSGRKDYATSGRIVPAAPPPVALVAAPGTIPAAAPARPSESFVDRLGAAVGLGSTPAAPAKAASAGGENCHPYNPVNGFVTPSDNGWNFVDFGVPLVKFGSDKVAAYRSAQIISAYHFDEQCVDTRHHPQMMYWKSGGVIPHDSLAGQDCVAVDPKAVQVVSTPDGWKVVEGNNTLFEYGDDQQSAQLTASVIRTYRLSRQCFVGGHEGAMRYWLSQ